MATNDSGCRCVLVCVATSDSHSAWESREKVRSRFTGPCQETGSGQHLNTLNRPCCSGLGLEESSVNHLQGTPTERALSRLGRGLGGVKQFEGLYKVAILGPFLSCGHHYALRKEGPTQRPSRQDETTVPPVAFPSYCSSGGALAQRWPGGTGEERRATWEGTFFYLAG